MAAFSACACLIAAPLPKPAFLGALAWSGYALAVDSAVYSLRGRSILRTRPEAFLWLAVLSPFLWLPFEWYNLRLAAWYWAGMPTGPSRYLLLGWIYACIWPAIFETADLLLATSFRFEPRPLPSESPRVGRVATVVAAGTLCLALPVLVPRLDLGEHLFALPSVGFLLLLDALNLSQGRPSLWLDWRARNRGRCAALAVSAAFCGLMAECLNFWADAKWHGIASLGADLGVFELSVLSYLAFPLFGLQSFAMYTFAAGVLNLPRADMGSRPPNFPDVEFNRLQE